MRLLEAEGFLCTRSGASLGVFDIIGISARSVVLVQVKSGRWPSTAEMQAIREVPAPRTARKLVHRWRSGVAEPDVREVLLECRQDGHTQSCKPQGARPTAARTRRSLPRSPQLNRKHEPEGVR